MKQIKKVTWFSMLGALLCLSLTMTYAQTSDTKSGDKNLIGVKSDTKGLSLFDPSRLRISNSYTFSYFSSGNTSGSLGIYTTTLNYQLSHPLSLTLSINYLHQPLSVFGSSGSRYGRNDLGIKNSVLPNFQLQYRPSNNFSFMINILTYPPPYSWGNEYLQREDKR